MKCASHVKKRNILKMGLLFDSYALDVLVTLASLVYVVYAYLTSTHSYWKDRGVPYKKPTLLFGVAKDQLLGRKGFAEIHMDIYKEAPDASAVGYFDFKQPKLMIRDPDLVEKVLIKEFANFHDRGFPYDLETEPLSGHLFNVEGSYWRNLRYKLTPIFTTGKLKSMFDQMSTCAGNLVKYVEKQSKINNDSSFEGKQLVNIYSVDVIASCAFGLEFSNESKEGRRYRQMIKEAFEPSVNTLLRFYILTSYPKLAKMLKLTNLPRHLNDYFMDILKEAMRFKRENDVQRNDFLQLMLTLQQQEQNKKLVIDNSHDVTNEEDAILNQLDNVPILDNRASTTKIFTDECLAAQCFVFLTAGSDPVANVSSFCFYALADNIRVQEKLQNEVDAVLEKYDGKWTYAAVKEMTYLDQVINETHRLYTPVPFLQRKCTKPFQLPDTKYVVEPDTQIIIPVACFHHDEKYFPNPHTFDPERFADGKPIQKGIYLPFGNGPRICIGMRFAQLETKVCIAHIVSAFNIRVCKKTIRPLQYEALTFILSPKGGLWLDFEKRVKA